MSSPRPFDHLTAEDLLEIAEGVVDGVQVRDVGLLASAAGRPATTVFGEEAYPELADKAAALLHSLARNHPLADGNKRLAWSAARVLCLLNGSDIVMDVDDAERMVLAAAAGELDAAALSTTVRQHLR